MKRLHLIILYIMLLHSYVYAQHVTLMTFNCENAFDLEHDEGKDDYEYLAGGMRNWKNSRLYHKLDGVAKIIAAADTLQPVGIVSLCEMENDSILNYLTRRTVLRSFDYDYIMTDSQDPRGVDVAIVYSRLVFRPIYSESIRPKYVGKPTRDILHVCGLLRGDTVDVYAVHLPSKLGGVESRDKGIAIAEGLKAHVDSIMDSRQTPRVIIMGDFNADLNTPLFSKILKAKKYAKVSVHEEKSLYDVVQKDKKTGIGTYKYHGVWTVIDHILVSGGVNVLESSVLALPSLLEDDAKYGGKKPRRTYVGYKYNGGISDHLPALLRIGL